MPGERLALLGPRRRLADLALSDDGRRLLVTSILQLAQSTYRKMVQNLWWAAGYNIFAIPVAAGVLYGWGILFGPAVGAALMSLSTVIVAINARFLTVERRRCPF